MTDHNDSIDPGELPEENFQQKEIFQHKQPADTGKPLTETGHLKKPGTLITAAKEFDKTSKEEGLNEKHSEGEAGAFEGFEDQQT